MSTALFNYLVHYNAVVGCSPHSDFLLDYGESTFHPTDLLNNTSLIIKVAKPADELIGYNAPITVITTDRTCSC